MDSARAWKMFMEGHPFLAGTAAPSIDAAGECHELVIHALDFHQHVVEALIRFANAVGTDEARTTADPFSETPKPREVSATTAMAPLEDDPILLTPRETEVLKLIAQGNSSKQVAYSLGISFKTAVCHRYNIMEKLNIHDVSGLVRYAIRNGLIRP